MKSCCGVTNTDTMGQTTALTTFTSELQKIGTDIKDSFTDSALKDITKRGSKGQHSINLISTRKLSEECGQRFNLANNNINQYYNIENPIGQGKYGKVYLGHSISGNHKDVAIKVIKIRKIKSNFESVMKEIEMMKSVSHPDIVKIIDIYRDSKKLYLVMELVKGEELFDYIVKRRVLDEEETRTIVRQLIKIVKYLNSIKITHRDLKPENIIIDPETLKIKLIDFGLSSYFNEFNKLMSPVGTPYYIAPEVLNRNYGKECDMWSIGVIAYICLTGSPPFQEESLANIYNDIINCNLTFVREEWENISEAGISFVRQLLQPKISERLNPNQALDSIWLNSTEIDKISYPLRLKNPNILTELNFEEYKNKTFDCFKKFIEMEVLGE